MTAVALHYTVDGPEDAPVLMLGSSLGTTGAMWAPQLDALAAAFRVVRYDHRGHGRSPVPTGPYTLDDLGGDVLALADKLGVDRVHLGGLSLGGMVAMWLAINAPERVDRMVLVCTSARLGPPEMWQARAATVRAQGTGAIADAVLGRWLPADYAGRHPEAVGDLRAMLLATPAEGYAACCDALERMDLEDGLSTVAAPTLVIAGLEDESTPPAHAQRIVDRIPDSRLALVAGAAHLANISRPELVGQLMHDHLTGAAT
jgi:3-oxoadipate enol-lactonase